jgi:hypothetical protein
MKKCKNCGKEINDKKVFCNQDCRDEYNERVKFTDTTCDYCNKDFKMETRFYRQWLNGKRNTKCCSIECHNRLLAKNNNVKPKTGITKICPQCGKEFYVRKYLIEQKEFCSRGCYDESRHMHFNCEVCGADATCTLSQYNRFEKHFCSKECKDYYMNEIWSKSDEGKEHVRTISIMGFQKQIDSNVRGMTKPEFIVFQYLNDCNIENISENYMHDKFFVDFYLPEYDAIIEVFGDYWHGNPKLYGGNLLPLNESQIGQQSKDKSRIAYLSKAHKYMIVLWEYDIINNFSECQEIINNIIN